MNVIDVPDRRGSGRRSADGAVGWLAIIIQLAMTVLAVGLLWGGLGGRLTLIEYRLTKIEQKLGM